MKHRETEKTKNNKIENNDLWENIMCSGWGGGSR